jgi:hypothetical protein
MNNQEHELQLRRMAMKISLDLSLLNRSDALKVIAMADRLIDCFVHPHIKNNDAAMTILEDIATGARRAS